MGLFLLEAGKFLVEHYDLITEIMDAIASGQSTKEGIRKAIRDSMVAASDATVEIELGPRPAP